MGRIRVEYLFFIYLTMRDSNTYFWKELTLDKKFIEVETNVSSLIETTNSNLSFISAFFNESQFLNQFLTNHQFFTISNFAKKLIDSLLIKHKIHNLNSEFYLLSAIFQKEYIDSYQTPPDMGKRIFEDFQNERKDLEELLNVLHDKLKKGNGILNSISFKTKGNTITINNFFIVKDVFDILITKYDLSIENFEERRIELIGETNNHKLGLFDEYQKWIFVKGLYNYISKDRMKNETLLNEDTRFVGSFMHIAQIPINKTQFEIIKIDDVNTLISINEIKYLHSFLTRPKSFFIK